MFIGHFGASLAAKRLAPRTSLGTLMLAGQFIDLMWPFLLLAGVEHVRIDPGNTAMTPLDFYDYPISHSLLTVVAWSLLFALIWRLISRDTRGAVVCGLLVFSHWLLDFITHRPDLPITPWSQRRVGLGLWQSVPATVLVEATIFILGVWLYWKTALPERKIAFWSLIGVLSLIAVANIFSPPPPSVRVIAVSGVFLLLFPLWGWWVDRTRPPRHP